MSDSQSFLRIPAIEDNALREQRLKMWLSADFRPVVAVGSGPEPGILRMHKGRVYVGIVLDYNLPERSGTKTDKFLLRKDVVGRSSDMFRKIRRFLYAP